ncbi:MAG: hypothetical protein ACI9BW_000840 [Gammaproteobacteria bacterium]|jgi:hypothetical protein
MVNVDLSEMECADYFGMRAAATLPGYLARCPYLFPMREILVVKPIRARLALFKLHSYFTVCLRN